MQEEDSEMSESQPLNARSTRQSCFMCKRRLEDKPSVNQALKLSFGLLQLFHYWTVLTLVYLKVANSKGNYSTLVIPLILLALELLFTCITVLFLIFNDLYYRRIYGITLWQRQAIGRLLRNILVLVLIGFSLFLLYLRADEEEIKMLRVLFPLLILNVIGFLRFLLISSDYSLFWVLSSALTLAQQVCLILKLDYSIDVPWVTILSPALMFTYIFSIFHLYLIWETHSDFLKSLVNLIAFSSSILISVVFTISLLTQLTNLFLVLCLVGIFILTLTYIEVFGGFIMDIAMGHIDIDILDIKHPIQSISNTPHSV